MAQSIPLACLALLILPVSGAAMPQETEASPGTIVVVDSVTPVRERAATRVRMEGLLRLLGETQGLRCADLQDEGLSALPSCNPPEYLAQLFPEPAARYNGISLTLAEAGDILRRNESVRDAAIRRACPQDSADCGARVHAAATAIVDDADRETARELEHLTALVNQGAPRIVLITAGLPFRQEPRALNRLVDAFRDSGTELVIVRLEASISFKGLMSDASDRLKSRLSGVKVVSLMDGNTDKIVESLAPRRADRRASLAAPPEAAVAALLANVQTYATRFAEELRFVIADETYKQEVRSRRGSFGATAGSVVAARLTEAEVAFAHIADGLWLMTRDVAAVDGRPVPDGPRPSLADVRNEREAVERLNALANDGARWNIGAVRRNINTPTMVMWFLTDPMVGRFRFSRAGSERTDAGECLILEFRETTTPPLLEVELERVPASGRIWVLKESGAVVRTELVLEKHEPAWQGGQSLVSRAMIRVDYQHWPEVGLWVPARMTERYEQPARSDADVIVSTASYSRYRQFVTRTRIR